MKTGYEMSGMSACEEEFYKLLEMKLDRIIELLERQGSVRPG